MCLCVWLLDCVTLCVCVLLSDGVLGINRLTILTLQEWSKRVGKDR